MTNLKVGDTVSWDGASWTVMDCGHIKEPLVDGTEGGWLTDIENTVSGIYTVREADVTITAWAPQPVTRKGTEPRPS
jgi:hypothetical protein